MLLALIHLVEPRVAHLVRVRVRARVRARARARARAGVWVWARARVRVRVRVRVGVRVGVRVRVSLHTAVRRSRSPWNSERAFRLTSASIRSCVGVRVRIRVRVRVRVRARVRARVGVRVRRLEGTCTISSRPRRSWRTARSRRLSSSDTYW